MTETNTINVAGLAYAVERAPYISKEEYTLGCIDYEKQVITIDEALSEEKAAVVLLHEVIHGILDELQFIEENQNEQLVQGLAVSLRMCLVSNPALFNITKSRKGFFMKKNTKQTSPEVARKAGKALRDGRTSASTKELAATALAQARGKAKRTKKGK